MFHVTKGIRAVTGSTAGRQVISVLTRGMAGKTYSTLNVTKPRDFVVQVEINRPEKRNAMNNAFFVEIHECFKALDDDPDCRAIVLSGAGKLFTAGLDLSDLGTVMMIRENEKDDTGRKAFKIRKFLEKWQDSFTALEKCDKPVIAAVHSACVGGGVDLTAACDIRYCSQDAWFQIKEIDLGLAADLGTLQRFPKVIGSESTARELAMTARPFYAEEAKQIGYVSRILQDRGALLEAALDTASLIASKSPIAVQGTKVCMNYARDHSVEEGLSQMRSWNQAMLQSDDLMKAATAMMAKEKATFSKL